MPVRKEHAKNCVISMRVSDEEKTILEELTRRSRQSISSIMREAIQLYAPALQKTGSHGR